MLPPSPRLRLRPKGLGEEEIGEERETRAPYNVTSVLSGGMVG